MNSCQRESFLTPLVHSSTSVTNYCVFCRAWNECNVSQIASYSRSCYIFLLKWVSSHSLYFPQYWSRIKSQNEQNSVPKLGMSIIVLKYCFICDPRMYSRHILRTLLNIPFWKLEPITCAYHWSKSVRCERAVFIRFLRLLRTACIILSKRL